MGFAAPVASYLRPDIDRLIDEVDSRCVLYLPLYKLPGDVIFSRDRNQYLCTNTGSIWTPQGRKFDAVDDRIALPAACYQLFNSAQGFSFELWADTSAAGVATPYLLHIGIDFPTNQPSIQLYANAARTSITALVRQTATEATNTHTQAGVALGWHQVGLSFNPSDSRVTLLIDGKIAGSDATNVLTFPGSDMGVGAIGTARVNLPWGNLIGEVRAYVPNIPESAFARNYALSRWRYR